MPATTISIAPQISEPIQISSTSLSGLATSSNFTLQALPSQSTSCHNAFALGEVFRFSSKEGRKRSKNLTVYVCSATGIVLLDANSQTVVSSTPFSSSLRPITPPLVLQDERYMLTFLVLHPRTLDDSAELHVWSEQSLGPSSAPLVKNFKCQISADVISLHPLSKTEIITRHKDGKFSIVNFNNFNEVALSTVKPSVGSNLTDRKTLFVDVFDRTDIIDLEGDTTERSSSSKALIVSITSPSTIEKSAKRPTRKGRKSATEIDGMNDEVDSGVIVEYLTVESGDVLSESRIRKVGQTVLSIVGLRSVMSLSLRPSGALSVILDDGKLISTVLQTSEDGGSPTYGEVSTINIPSAAGSISSGVLSTSAFTALVSFSTIPTSGRAQLHLLLVNTQLGCILAEQSWKAPEDCRNVFIKPLNMTRSSSAILFSIPKSLDQAKPQTHLWNASFQLGEGGNLRWALASRQLTKRWTTVDSSTAFPEKGHQKDLIQKLHSILTSDRGVTAKSKEIEEYFDGWVKQNFKTTTLTQPAVSEILSVVLPTTTEPGNKSDQAYPKKLVHYFLDEHLIRSLSINPNTFLTSMATVGDWEGVMKALDSVESLSEDDVVTVIRMASHQEKENVVKVSQILSRVTQLQLSSAELRNSMRTRLDERSVEMVLQSLNEWLKPSKEDALLEITSNEIAKGKVQIEKPTIPQALRFSIEVLDTFFPLMLNTPSFKSLLEQLSSSIERHLSTVDSLNLIRGPLAAFAKLNEDRQREIENEQIQLAREMAELQRFNDDIGVGGLDDIEALKRSEKFASGLYKNKGPDSSRGKQGKIASQSNIAQQIGAGSLSRSGQRPLTRGQQSVVNNVAVGLYALEQFEI